MSPLGIICLKIDYLLVVKAFAFVWTFCARWSRTNPVGNHLTFSFHGHLAATSQWKVRCLLFQDAGGCFATLDTITCCETLHSRRRVHCVSKQSVTRIQRSNDVADNWTRVEAYSNMQSTCRWIVFVNHNIACCSNCFDRKLGDALHMGIVLVLLHYTQAKERMSTTCKDGFRRRHARCMDSQFVTPTQASPMVSTLKTSCLFAKASIARYKRSNIWQTFTAESAQEISVNRTISLKKTVALLWVSLFNGRKHSGENESNQERLCQAWFNLRFNLSTGLELVSDLLWEHLVQHITGSHFCTKTCISFFDQWFTIL
jgi:hypothetical protein